VTVNASESMAGLYTDMAGVTLTIKDAGNNTGNLSITAGVQGFLLKGNTVITCPITGPGGLEPEWEATSSLSLFGNNTYSGGTLLVSSSAFVYINSSSSFGTGPITLGETAGYYCPLFISGGSTVTIPNNIIPAGTGTMGGINVAQGSAIFSGTVTAGAAGNPLQIRNNSTGNPVTFSGAIGDTGGGLTVSSANSTTIYLSGANTYTGPTTIGVTGDAAITLAISGSGTLGNTGTGTGSYAGAIPNTGTAFVYNSSSAQTLSGLISGTGALNMTGSGSLKLSAANTYSGATTITAGTLEISGSIANSLNVTSTGGTLKLDNASALSVATILTLAATPANGAVDLNFTGTQYISGLKYGTTVMANGTYGSLASSAQNKSATFTSTGLGILAVTSAPLIVTEPQPTSVWPGGNATFSVAAVGPGTLTYQWSLNGTSLGSSATASSYTVTGATSLNAGNYTSVIANGNLPNATTTGALLTVLTTNAYNSAVLADNPISYWRLDEASGTTAYDYVGGNNGTYHNVLLNQTPGYSVLDSDACIGLQAAPSYVSVANYQAFNFFTNPSPTFTLEGWVKFTSVAGVQRLFSTDQNVQPLGYMFGISGANQLVFTTSSYNDYFSPTLASPLQVNVWYQLAVGCDGSSLYFYVNGQPVGTVLMVANPRGGTNGVPMCLGANGNFPGAYEQVQGELDECAIYGTYIGGSELLAHYNATLPAVPVAQTPVADQPTNYASLTTTFTENAVGTGLLYQWTKVGSLTVLSTGSTLTLSSLALTDAGSYQVAVSNGGGSTNPPAAALTVLAIPATAAQVGLTNGMVLHLPFDTDYKDISGRNNNGTAVGATTVGLPVAGPAAVGGGALHYSSDTTPSYNYVTLGKPSDLQFGNNVDFTVAFWVRQAFADISTNLPFFASTVGSIGANLGFCFAPGLTSLSTPNGGWAWEIYDGTHQDYATGAPSSISDGNWHHLAFAFNRTANVTTYLDGQQVDSRSDAYLAASIDSGTNINIGQDATGTFVVPAAMQGDLDDLGVWRRALTQLEISGMYLAGKDNTPGVSFAPVITAVTPAPTTISNILGTSLTYGGGAGSQFVLLSNNIVSAPLSTWKRVATNSSTPGSFTIPAVGSPSTTFYRVQSQ
jgi:autotransporter-associated beta strand protein